MNAPSFPNTPLPAIEALPIVSILPSLKRALAEKRAAVLQAPPGMGKTTGIPLALLTETWLGHQRIVMLEPRRLATRAAAARMAALVREPVGRTVGYRTRLDRRISTATRIEVVTEGILTRQLQNDPALEGVGMVIFDEFHERSLHADTGLALCLDSRAALREDLRMLVMSATLDAQPVATLMGAAPVITGSGQHHPVTVHHSLQTTLTRLKNDTVAAVRHALTEEKGDILVFLPGAAEIRRVSQGLQALALPTKTTIYPLFGSLPQTQQDLAIRPSPDGRRKIVLATAIAETSLTIEGIRVVIDTGFMRVPRYDVRSGMTRLTTIRVTRDTAIQRRGRAGRVAPGVCYRLWPRALHSGLTPHNTPEIMHADLTGLALELALWGLAAPGELSWLDAPPAAAYAEGRALLGQLGALDQRGQVTPHGKRMATLGVHPRLAHLLLCAANRGLGRLGCELAALLGERDILPMAGEIPESDLRTRVALLRREITGQGQRNTIYQRVWRDAQALARRLGIAYKGRDAEQTGALVAEAYPDRIARKRDDGRGRFQLANGRGAWLPDHDPLAGEPWLAVASLDGQQGEARIYLAAPLDPETIQHHMAHRIELTEKVYWDSDRQAVAALRQHRLNRLTLSAQSLAHPPPEQVLEVMLAEIHHKGLGMLPWTAALRAWQSRTLFLRRVQGIHKGWPDLTDTTLLATLEKWLGPYLSGVNSRARLQRIDLRSALYALLPWERHQALDRLAPTHLQVPSGSRIRIDYTTGEHPILAVRLQEIYGWQETPAIVRGQVPLQLHLLSPAGRSVQITSDLAGFWCGTYHAVRKDLRGRYPKHHWPEDPQTAQATRGLKPSRQPKVRRLKRRQQ